MGLDGAFAKAELIRRYRDLQAAVHPDKGGSGYFAKQLNWARDVIMRRHGW